MLRWLKLQTLHIRRKHRRDSKSWLSKFMASELVHWNRRSATRGAAVGLFWAFTPIPFQMFPATLFCVLVGGNLPLTLIFVWLTNPITLPPILYLEFRIGQYVSSLFTMVDHPIVEHSNIFSAFAGSLQYVLTGSLIVSCTMMILGYFLMHLAFNISEKQRERTRNRHSKIAQQDSGKTGAS